MLDFGVINSTHNNPTLFTALYAFFLSFVLGAMIAWTYIKTFRGLSYSRNFIHCLVYGPIVTALAMQAIGDNIARGIGIMGAISLLRFRTNIKDPRDMFFVFAALSVGLACGVHSYSIAVLGAIAFIFTSWILGQSNLTVETHFDGLLKLNLEKATDSQGGMEKVLQNYCDSYSLVSLREMTQGSRLDYTYQVKLKKQIASSDFVKSIQDVRSAQSVQLLLQEAVVEL